MSVNRFFVYVPAIFARSSEALSHMPAKALSESIK
jgi:hypothetical protein